MDEPAGRPTEGRGESWWPESWPIEPTDDDIDVVIPALDEEATLPRVLADLPEDFVRRVVVVDNGSTDATAEVARENGAEVVSEPRKGYGSACLTGLARLEADAPDVVVFLDADFSDVPSELPRLLAPIFEDAAELVIGSRTLGRREPGALRPQARFGNRLACLLIESITGYRFTDLGPFRAVRWETLRQLEMQDPDYGWTVEMQIKAALRGVDAVEVPVSYRRRREGESKVSGTIKGSVLAGAKILSTIASAWSREERR